jgi:hypothetical protein
MTLLLALQHILGCQREDSVMYATVPDANICNISIWSFVGGRYNTANNATVYFSDLIAGHVWSTGTCWFFERKQCVGEWC